MSNRDPAQNHLMKNDNFWLSRGRLHHFAPKAGRSMVLLKQRAFKPIGSSPKSVVAPVSRRTIAMLFVASFFLVESLSTLTPPFQSPDEFDHVKRAYLLSKGEILSQSENGLTGGYIDSGLLGYMDCFQHLPFNYAEKASDSQLSQCTVAKWDHKEKFKDFPTYASYFPLLYTPQALALLVGRVTGLTIRDSYYLSRLFSLISTLVILYAATGVYPLPLTVIGLFMTPMTLFQMGSASLDAMTFAVTAMATALFMRAANKNLSFSVIMHSTLVACLFLLASARIYLAAITLLPAVIYLRRGSRQFLASAASVSSLTIGWIYYVISTVHQFSITGAKASQIAQFYLWHPSALFAILYATVTDSRLLLFYVRSFIGIFGWLDTPLSTAAYFLFAILSCGLLALCIRRPAADPMFSANLALAAAATISYALMLLIFLFTLTAQSAKVIGGVQGRYFTPIFILFFAATCRNRLSPAGNRAGIFLLFMLLQLSAISSLPVLLHRYWIFDE